jgi:hypothetical protein
MKHRERITRYRALREQPQWKLLAAANAPEIIGLLQSLLMDGERTLPAAVLHDRLQRALDQLNGDELSRELPRTAQAYIAHWLAQGWLERRLPEGADQEQYELSTQALQAIRFADSLEQSRVAATESRLALVIEQLSQLAAQTESDPDARLSALRDERDRIDAEIARVGVGRVATLDGKRALERARQIIGLADDLTEDFRRVRDDFERLNREFRERIIDDESERGDVLSRLFEGVDVIGDSDAGRSFQAFWRLLNDAEQSAQLDAALETVLARGFAASWTATSAPSCAASPAPCSTAAARFTTSCSISPAACAASCRAVAIWNSAGSTSCSSRRSPRHWRCVMNLPRSAPSAATCS